MAGMLRIPRSRGALSGALLVLLGLWGGLAPLIGPAAGYGYTPDRVWAWTPGRLWLDVLPAAVTLVGGAVVLATRLRPVALAFASLSVLAGAWFAVGGQLAPLWDTGITPGTPLGGTVARAAEQIGIFTGLGVAVACVACAALGRLTVLSARDGGRARRALLAEDTGPVGAPA